jgi:hypothetical protein
MILHISTVVRQKKVKEKNFVKDEQKANDEE